MSDAQLNQTQESGEGADKQQKQQHGFVVQQPNQQYVGYATAAPTGGYIGYQGYAQAPYASAPGAQFSGGYHPQYMPHPGHASASMPYSTQQQPNQSAPKQAPRKTKNEDKKAVSSSPSGTRAWSDVAATGTKVAQESNGVAEKAQDAEPEKAAEAPKEQQTEYYKRENPRFPLQVQWEMLKFAQHVAMQSMQYGVDPVTYFQHMCMNSGTAYNLGLTNTQLRYLTHGSFIAYSPLVLMANYPHLVGVNMESALPLAAYLSEVKSSSGRLQPPTVETHPARFFQIKCTTDNEIHKGVKYCQWACPRSLNDRIEAAFNDMSEKNGNVFLFVSGSTRRLAAVAEVMSVPNYEAVDPRFDPFTDSNAAEMPEPGHSCKAGGRWHGLFQVRWHYIKYIPKTAFDSLNGRVVSMFKRGAVEDTRVGRKGKMTKKEMFLLNLENGVELDYSLGTRVFSIVDGYPGPMSLLSLFRQYDIEEMDGPKPDRGEKGRKPRQEVSGRPARGGKSGNRRGGSANYNGNKRGG